MQYEYKDGELCDCCEYPAPIAVFDRHTGQVHQFCEVCSSTYLSQLRRPGTGDIGHLASSIGYIANLILDAINKQSRVKGESDTPRQ